MERAKVVNDGWVGGYVWFGSVHSSVELRKRVGVRSTFVIKSNKCFSLKVLHRTLVVRHGNWPAAHLVFIDEFILGVNSMANACVWSQCVVSHVMSETGSIEMHDDKCLSSFEDDFGSVFTKEIKLSKFFCPIWILIFNRRA